MTLTLNILGIDLLSLSLDIEQPAGQTAPEAVFNRGIKQVSRFWVDRMMSR